MGKWNVACVVNGTNVTEQEVDPSYMRVYRRKPTVTMRVPTQTSETVFGVVSPPLLHSVYCSNVSVVKKKRKLNWVEVEQKPRGRDGDSARDEWAVGGFCSRAFLGRARTRARVCVNVWARGSGFRVLVLLLLLLLHLPYSSSLSSDRDRQKAKEAQRASQSEDTGSRSVGSTGGRRHFTVS